MQGSCRASHPLQGSTYFSKDVRTELPEPSPLWLLLQAAAVQESSNPGCLSGPPCELQGKSRSRGLVFVPRKIICTSANPQAWNSIN